jgi:hypothetical protein
MTLDGVEVHYFNFTGHAPAANACTADEITEPLPFSPEFSRQLAYRPQAYMIV